nr:hypothetical protein [Tanacetum cinerariifolium]
MTNYSLWEVILNGDSPIPTRVVDGVVQPVAPSTAEQRLAKKNELKARGTLLMALPEKHISMPTSPVHDRYKSREGYHVDPPPYTGTFMPPKSDLVFYDAFTANETVPTVLNVEPSTTNPNKDLSQLNRPSVPIIKDWVSDSKDESDGEPMPTQKAPSFV